MNALPSGYRDEILRRAGGSTLKAATTTRRSTPTAPQPDEPADSRSSSGDETEARRDLAGADG